MTDTERIARKRVEDLKGFYLHLLIFVLVNFGLFVVNAVQGSDWWFYWTTVPWGAGLLAHGAAVYFSGRRLAAWEQRKVAQYVDEATEDEPVGTGLRH